MTVTHCLPRPRSVLFGLVMTAGLCAVGCSCDVPVQGYVHLNGQPVTAGTVVFTGLGTNATYTTPIQPDGTYSLNGLPADNYLVTLLNPQAPLSGVIPDRYASTASSGLEAVLNFATSAVTYNIDLTN